LGPFPSLGKLSRHQPSGDLRSSKPLNALVTKPRYIDSSEMSIVGPPPQTGWRFFCPRSPGRDRKESPTGIVSFPFRRTTGSSISSQPGKTLARPLSRDLRIHKLLNPLVTHPRYIDSSEMSIVGPSPQTGWRFFALITTASCPSEAVTTELPTRQHSASTFCHTPSKLSEKSIVHTSGAARGVFLFPELGDADRGRSERAHPSRRRLTEL